MPSAPLPTKYEVTKQEEAQMPEAGPNAVEPRETAGSFAVILLPNPVMIHRCRLQVNRPNRRKAEVPKLESVPQTSQGDHWVFLMLALLPDPSQAYYCNLQVNRPSLRSW